MIFDFTTTGEKNDPGNFGAADENSSSLLNNRIEALRVLVTVLLREVESLEHSVPNGEQALTQPHFSLAGEIERYEVDMIRCALIKSQGKQCRAAKLLGLKVTTLNCKIKKYKINWRITAPENDFVV